ncbi:orotidine-5'-phosphate decarboxylase [Candidatus Pacearchaeota archaeon]|nr:MAG: orotidine-5'-phosphate decarboxylase [Candidatus Pacearchaeota archaeon]
MLEKSLEYYLKKIIVALDIKDYNRAIDIIDKLDFVEIFKIGHPLFLPYGWKVVEYVKKKGKKVFLDLKLCDIPSVVGKAVRECSVRGVDFLTLHIWGGKEMLEVALENSNGTKLIGVTVLTSISEIYLKNVLGIDVKDVVVKFAKEALEVGLWGIVISPNEIDVIKNNFGDKLKMVVPGIKIKTETFDQKRRMGLRDVFKKNVDYVVIGREIYQNIDRDIKKFILEAIYG